MRSNRLNIFEKLWLWGRAWYDVRHEQFQKGDAVTVDSNLQKQKRSKRTRTPDPRPTDHQSNTNQTPFSTLDRDDYLIISPFINAELGKYEALREYVLGSRFVTCQLVNDKLRKHRVFAPFADILGDIDQQVDVFASGIDLMVVEYEEQIQQWQSRRVSYEDRGEAHMVQMCINRILNLRSEYYSKTSRMYSSVVHLLDEKVKLITAAEALLKEKRGHIFLRIRYYYQKAVMFADGLPADYLRDEVLMSIGNAELLMSLEDVRNEAQDKLKQFRDEIASFTPLR